MLFAWCRLNLKSTIHIPSSKELSTFLNDNNRFEIFSSNFIDISLLSISKGFFFQSRRLKEKIIGELTKATFEKQRLFLKILESLYLVKQCVIYKYDYAEKLLDF